MATLDENHRTDLRKGVIGFVFQSFNLIDELNVRENIELPLLYMGVPAKERRRRAEEVMNLLKELNQQGTTVVMVTHSRHDASYANRIINLFDGSIVKELPE